MQSRPGQAVTTLRDLNNAAFLHRERARFYAGRSALLDVALEPQPGDGIAIDVTGVAELSRIVTATTGLATIGAFVTLEELGSVLPALCPPDAGIANVRLRLALHDARVIVYGLGRSRAARIEELRLAAHEVPVAIEVRDDPTLTVTERRRATKDGDASFALGVTIALRVSRLARFEHVRIFIDVDGAVQRAAQAEAKLEKQRCDRDLLAEAARLAAASIPAEDARSSAIARALMPLVLASLRDAFDAARRVTEHDGDAKGRPRP